MGKTAFNTIMGLYDPKNKLIYFVLQMNIKKNNKIFETHKNLAVLINYNCLQVYLSFGIRQIYAINISMAFHCTEVLMLSGKFYRNSTGMLFSNI